MKALLASCLVIVLTMNSYEYNSVSEGDHTMDDFSIRKSGRGYLRWLCDHRLITVTTDLAGGRVGAGFTTWLVEVLAQGLRVHHSTEDVGLL